MYLERLGRQSVVLGGERVQLGIQEGALASFSALTAPQCMKCHKKDARAALQKCAGCKCTLYCGAVCQKSDWKRHKLECAKLKAKRRADEFVSNEVAFEDLALFAQRHTMVPGRNANTGGRFLQEYAYTEVRSVGTSETRTQNEMKHVA